MSFLFSAVLWLLLFWFVASCSLSLAAITSLKNHCFGTDYILFSMKNPNIITGFFMEYNTWIHIGSHLFLFSLVPAGDTEFAKDAVFGYKASNLREVIGFNDPRVDFSSRKVYSAQFFTFIDLSICQVFQCRTLVDQIFAFFENMAVG